MSKKFNKAVASTVACLVVSSVVQMPAFAATTTVSGTGRVQTAIQIAEQSWNDAWKGKTEAVLSSANDANLVDALAVAPFAFQQKAPILITENGDVVNPDVMVELKAKNVKTVYLTAGTGVLTDKMKVQLEAAGMTVVRLGGKDRFETAMNITNKITSVKGYAVVNSDALADALSIASIAAAQGYAIALAPDKDTAPADQMKAGLPVYAIGGNGVLSDSLVAKLGAKRLGGSSRYETNGLVLEGLKASLKYDKVYVANGVSLVDALPGSVLAAQTNSPIVLAGPSLDAKQAEVVKANAKKDVKDVNVIQLGGAVPTSVISAVESGLVPVPVVTPVLNVQGVSTINSREIQVALTAPADATSAKDLSNYIISLDAAKYDTTDKLMTILQKDSDGNVMVRFNSDTNVVTFRLVDAYALNNGTKYSVDIRDGILTKDKSARLPKYTDTQKTFNDTTAPTLVSAAVESNKLVLKFNKPVVAGLTVTVDGQSVTLDKPSDAILDYSVKSSAILQESLRTTGAHTVTIWNARDLVRPNSNGASILTGTFKVESDTTAPAVKEVKQGSSDRDVEVVFTEGLSSLDETRLVVKKGNYTFQQTSDASANAGSTTYKIKKVLDGGKVVITFGADSTNAINPLYVTGENSTTISVEVDNYRDTVNLSGPKYNGSVTLNKDTNSPSVSSKYNNKIDVNRLNIVFNKSLSSSDIDASKITVADKDGTNRTVSNVSVNDKTVILSLYSLNDNDAVEGKATYTVNFAAGAVRALANRVYNDAIQTNVLPTNSIVAPLAEAVTSVVSTGSKITVTYNVAMSQAAAALVNYTLDGAALPSGTVISMDGSDKVITITLPEAYASVVITRVLTVSKAITTAAGSAVVGSIPNKSQYETSLQFVDNTKPTLADAKYLITESNQTTTKKIKLVFSEAIKGINNIDAAKNDLKVVVNGSTQNIVSIANSTRNNKEVTITLDNGVNLTQAANILIVPVGTENNTSMEIQDLAGNTVKDTSTTVSSSNEYDLDNMVINNDFVNYVAANLASPFAAEGKVGDVVLPTVYSGFQISVKSTSNATIYGTDAKLMATGTAQVVYTVKNNATGAMSDSKAITVNVIAAPLAPVIKTLTGSLTDLGLSYIATIDLTGVTYTDVQFFDEKEVRVESKVKALNFQLSDEASTFRVLNNGTVVATGKLQ